MLTLTPTLTNERIYICLSQFIYRPDLFADIDFQSSISEDESDDDSEVMNRYVDRTLQCLFVKAIKVA